MRFKILLIIQLFVGVSSLMYGQDKSLIDIQKVIKGSSCDSVLIMIDNVIYSNEMTSFIYYNKAFCEYKLNYYDSAIVSSSIALEHSNKLDTLYEKTLFLRSLAYTKINNLELGIIDNEKLVEEFPLYRKRPLVRIKQKLK